MIKAIIEKINNAAVLHEPVTLSGEQAQRLVAEYQRLNMALSAQPQEPVAKRWLVEKYLPSGSISWEVFEHELHAQNAAKQYERAGSKTTVTPLYTQPQEPQRIDAEVAEWSRSLSHASQDLIVAAGLIRNKAVAKRLSEHFDALNKIRMAINSLRTLAPAPAMGEEPTSTFKYGDE